MSKAHSATASLPDPQESSGPSILMTIKDGEIVDMVDPLTLEFSPNSTSTQPIVEETADVDELEAQRPEDIILTDDDMESVTDQVIDELIRLTEKHGPIISASELATPATTNSASSSSSSNKAQNISQTQKQKTQKQQQQQPQQANQTKQSDSRSSMPSLSTPTSLSFPGVMEGELNGDQPPPLFTPQQILRRVERQQKMDVTVTAEAANPSLPSTAPSFASPHAAAWRHQLLRGHNELFYGMGHNEPVAPMLFLHANPTNGIKQEE
eukprot:TRINITY_DN2795_c0_g2_i3.p1 TRINITY_DN2795_c0_g2~~TRINITY_DN2795_c0_g2_i3.p1  ORF type:complete len:275 (+),score=76.72 TRINITY_DN2795_c0_g2_i3:26-826(+)